MKKIKRVFLYIVVLVIIFGVVAPYIWLVISSVSTEAELLRVPLKWFPKTPNFKGYKEIIFGGRFATRTALDFKKAVLNSLIVALSVTILCMVSGSISAYSFSRFRYKTLNFTFLAILAAQMLPPIVIAIPMYMIFLRIGILDNYITLIIVYSSFVLPLAIWFMKGFFDTIPEDIEEAAMVDGCSRIRSLVQIVLPLSSPGIASTSIFVFIISWNEFFFAFLYTSTLTSKTLPVLVSEFASKIGVDYVMMSTAGVLASLPPIVLALLFQKYIVKGLTSGGVKG